MIPGIVAVNNAFTLPASIPWTPLNLSQVPPIYLDADDSGYVLSGSSVTTINNLGSFGANGNFTQSSASAKPTKVNAELNGKSIVRFDGIDDWLSCSTTQMLGVYTSVPAMWTFAVYKKTTLDGSPTSRYLYSTVDTGNFVRHAVFIGNSIAGQENKPAFFARRSSSESTTRRDSPNVRQGSYCILLTHGDLVSNLGVIRENGSSAASGVINLNAGNSTAVTLSATNIPTIGAFAGGSSAMADIDLACFITGNTALSTPEIEKLEGWAAHKWGLSSSLPSGHPYKTLAPTV